MQCYSTRLLAVVLTLIFLGTLTTNRYGVLSSEYVSRSLVNNQGPTNNTLRISLTFVFDTTGSMFDDLVQVRGGAARILNKTIENGENAVRNYILVPFRDPDVGPALQTNDPEKFLNALNNIEVLGGQDCPEMSVTAIKLALERSLPGSVIYVFTDAEAKDYKLLPDVIKLLREKSIRVNFVLTGTCAIVPAEYNDTHAYETIATLSSGQIVKLNKSEVGEIWKFVEISINSKLKGIFSADKLTWGEKTYYVILHEVVDEIIATASGEEIHMTVRDGQGRLVYPRDTGVEVIFNLRSGISVLVKDPPAGNWSFTVRSKGRHTLRVEGISARWKEVDEGHKTVVIPDINECLDRESHNCRADEFCQDLPNGYTCIKMCTSGFEKTSSGECADINECTRTPDICGDRECSNTYGGYKCMVRCEKGLKRIENYCTDVNECLQYLKICGDMDCINTYGSYRCESMCPKGFQHQAETCIDIDECSRNSEICGGSLECVNTHGSYRCEKNCSNGYKRNGNGVCTDMNECEETSLMCGDRKCVNIQGSYRCETRCPRGHKRSSTGSCVDINECRENPSICGSSECINTRGSYVCETKCPVGYRKGTAGLCVDINECVEERSCQYDCRNTLGSFQCLCPRGTRLDVDQVSCIGTDICRSRGYGNCQHTCNPRTGQCECPKGYRLYWDKVSCIDINECASGQHACGSRECFNTLGKYHCLNVSCPVDYYVNQDGYCIKQCDHNSGQSDCPGEYSSIRHNAVSIPCYLPINTDFFQLDSYVPQARNYYQLPCYCYIHFYPMGLKNKELFGLYQTGEVGRLYNRVVFETPGFYELQVFSDFLNGYGGIVSRTVHRIYVDVSEYTF